MATTAATAEVDAKVAVAKTSGVLDLTAMALSALPRALITAVGPNVVRKLILRRNRITQLGEDVAALGTELKELDASRNNVATLGEALGQANGLEVLCLARNRLCGELPAFVCTAFAQSLVRLDLSSNGLTRLPAEIGRLQSLRELCVSRNALETLPTTLCDLPRLETLCAAGNALRELPAELGRLAGSLVRLDVSENNLIRLPHSFAALGSRLIALDLAGNPWLCPRASVCERGREAVFAELARMAAAKATAARSTLVDVREGVVGAELRCVLIARDEQGAARMTGGDTVSAVLMLGTTNVACDVKDCGDGCYAITATAAAPGLHSLVVSCNGAALPECPLPLRVCPAPADVPADIDAAIGDGVLTDKYEPDPALPAFSALLKWCRELNVAVAVPEVVVCGCEGYEQLAEAVWGLFPLDFAAGFALRRPLVFNIARAEDLKPDELRVTLRRDKLLGAGVSLGMRDAPLPLSSLREHIEARNSSAASTVPVVVQVESSTLVGCTVTLAPALPPDGDPARAGVEMLLRQLLRTASAVLCALPCLPQQLTRTSSWLARVLEADPRLAHTALAFTGFYNALGAVHSPNELAQLGLGAGHEGYFVSLLTPQTRAACAGNAAQNEFYARLARADVRDRLAAASVGNGSVPGAMCVGTAALRERMRGLVAAVYRGFAPPLHQRAVDNVESVQRSADIAHAELEALKAGGDFLAASLRSAASSHALGFCSVVGEVLRGTAQGRPTERGQTLAEEQRAVALTTSSAANAATANATTTVAVDNAQCRLYGGAQLVRALDHFRQLVADAAAHGLPATTAAEAGSSVSAACEVAQREARNALVPLIGLLCDHAVVAIRNAADVAVAMFSARTAETNAMTLTAHLAQFSYLERNVRDLFVEMAEQRVADFRAACNSDLPSPTPAAGLGLPVLAVDAGGLGTAAASLFRKLVLHVGDAVAARFFMALPGELLVSLPAEMHAALVSMEDRHLANIFKLQALEDTLARKEAAAQKQLADARDKLAAVTAIAL